MRMRQRTFVAVAWAALLAMLMALVAPTLSHAFADPSNAIAVEICSASGPKLTYTLVIDNDKPASKQLGSSKQCAYCHSWQGAFALPSGSFRLPLFTGAFSRPPLFYTAPTPLFSWIVAQPRGPPSA